ncbi:MAG: DUF3617 domain-containing protein [Vicinamibacterales bacterium]
MKWLIALALLTATVPALAQGSGPRRDGNWEVEMRMEMPGMPGGMPPFKVTQCITPQEASDPAKVLPQGPGGRGANPNDCKMSDYKVEGNKVSWKMTCAGARPMTGTSEIVYGTDSYTGTMVMQMDRGTMTMKYSGKRLGDCTK